MKKRIVSLLLALAMVSSVLVAPAYGAELNTGGPAVTAPAETTCGCGCGKKLSEVAWKVWAGEVASGHFYLTGNQTLSETVNVISGESLVLDLRGYAITTDSRIRNFYVCGYLGILDTVGGGRITGMTVKDNGGLVYVVDNETAGSMFELFSGTLTPETGASAANSGGLIYLGDGATFRMHDGLLLNGKSASGKTGGAIAAGENTTVEILGGSLVGGETGSSGGNLYSAGTTTLKNCTILGGIAGSTGGNLYIKGDLTAENCVIADGTALATGTYGGGNINTAGGGKLTFTNCQIWGGYCPGYGGNISFGWGTQTLTNTEVYGGVSGRGGHNIALTHASSNLTLNNSTVDGGMARILGKVTLKGATQISLNNGGLDLSEQSSKATVATGLTAGAEVYVSGNKTLTGSADHIKPALRTTLTASGTTLTLATAPDGETAGYCPHCNAQAAWQPYGTAGATHVYLTEDLTDFAQLTVDGDLCIDLCGFSITAPGRAFSVAEGGKLMLLDSVGTGAVSGSGVAAENGGVFQNAGNLTLMGGKYTYVKNADIAGGGVIYNSGALTLSDVILDATAYSSTEYNGGAVCMAPAETATMTFNGGYVLGGTANYGGGIFCDYKSNSTITGVHLVGGIATIGGNLATYGTTSTAAKTIQLTMTGCRITEGKAQHTSASEFGGNLYLGYCVANITDCLVLNGDSDKYGGNFSVGLGTAVNFTTCIIEGGTAESRGGQVYAPGNSSYFTLDRCLMTNGTAPAGGNIYVNNGTCTVKGGEVSYGTAGNYGGNVYAASDDATGVTLGADSNGNAPLICHGTAGNYGGNLYAKKIVTVNAALFHSGTASVGKDLYVTGSTTNLVLGEGVIGTIRMNAGKELLTSQVYGGTISNITCKAENAAFLMDTLYGDCGVVVKDETMYVSTTAVVDSYGNAAWYSSNADAVEACGSGSFVKLFTNNDLVLTKDLYVDLNGNTVAVSGDYAFYGMDSSGDSYAEPTGSATGTAAKTYDMVEAPNGNRYLSVVTDGAATYHRLNMAITGVSIRPSVDGIYYTAKWSCDDTVKDLVHTYGLVVSTANAPDDQFANDSENIWTVNAKETFESGATKCSAIISGILKTDRTAGENSACGKSDIYAKAYLTFADGSTCVSNENVAYSLYDIMLSLDKLILTDPIRYRPSMTAARNFYEKWKEMGMGDWKLSKIPQPEDNGIIDVLMIGNSWTSYFVEELYAMVEAGGKKIRICNVYYSGCTIDEHYNWWKNGESHYQFFETDGNGRKKKGNDVSLEWCLAQGEWDVITMNLGGGDMRTQTADTLIEINTPCAKELFAYLGESFPQADLYMHQSWAYELGFSKEYTEFTFKIETVEEQMAFTEKTRQVVNAICEASGVGRINTGDAWEVYRAACTEKGIENNLCARLGSNNHQGDGGHDGDIGGGQYLNACVWFEILTGLDCRDTTYIPTYTYDGVEYPMSETMAEMLQDAAHEAASVLWYNYPENAQ